MPERVLLERLGRALGRSTASRPETAKAFDSREDADEDGPLLLGIAGCRPTLNLPMPTGELRTQLDERLAYFRDAYWRGGQEHSEGCVRDHATVSMVAVQRAYPDHRFLHGCVGILHSDYLVVFVPSSCRDESAEETEWNATVRARKAGGNVLVEADVHVGMPYVGPWIRDWRGEDQIRGLQVLLEVLRRSFGDCPGLAVTAWKTQQAEKDLASRDHVPVNLLPAEFEPVMFFEFDRGFDDRRAALVQHTGAEDAGVYFTVTLGPLSNIPTYLKRRENTLITDIMSSDSLFISELQRVVDKYINGNGKGEESSS